MCGAFAVCRGTFIDCLARVISSGYYHIIICLYSLCFQYFIRYSVMAAIGNLSWAFDTDVNDVITINYVKIVSGVVDHQAITVQNTR